MIAQTFDATTIHASQLTEGDIIQHRPGDNWMVITEPEYTTAMHYFCGALSGCRRSK